MEYLQIDILVCCLSHSWSKEEFGEFMLDSSSLVLKSKIGTGSYGEVFEAEAKHFK